MRRKNIGVLMYTYDRTDDARINMEIIRNVWEKNEYLASVKIIHAFNGKKKWYPEKHLEDELVTIKNSWHFQGAADLIDAGIKKFKTDIDYAVVLAADTWLIDPNYLEKMLEKMDAERLYLATCAWGEPKRNDIREVGMAVDFFIVDMRWARKNKMFPINYGGFYRKYEDLLLYQKVSTIMLEKLMLVRYVQAVGREETANLARKKAFKKMLIMKDREVVHKNSLWLRKHYWPKMGLLTHHFPLPKKKILKARKITEGENIKKLLESQNLDYYNNGAKETNIQKL